MEVERGRTGRGLSHLSNGKAPRGEASTWPAVVGVVRWRRERRGRDMLRARTTQRNANSLAVATHVTVYGLSTVNVCKNGDGALLENRVVRCLLLSPFTDIKCSFFF